MIFFGYYELESNFQKMLWASWRIKKILFGYYELESGFRKCFGLHGGVRRLKIISGNLYILIILSFLAHESLKIDAI
jgi:hypothetical protein